MSRILPNAALFVAAMLMPPPHAAAKSLTLLTTFNGYSGKYPLGSLIADSAGNLYGTTEFGGASGHGTVFKLAPPAAGQTAWTETVLIAFNGKNGAYPNGSLIADPAGNFYGTTLGGGTSCCGTVFQLTPPASGQTAWTETIITAFSGNNGASPGVGLIADDAGNLYGTTNLGGESGYGTVFRLTPPATGQTVWPEAILFSFAGANGENPFGSLIADRAGYLYGTTQQGGSSRTCTHGCGTVFKLTPPPPGKTGWTETVLTIFNGKKGKFPLGALLADSAGNLYGMTQYGGRSGHGTVFKLTPPASGQTAWTEAVLTAFTGRNGAFPEASLIVDGAGNLYGMTPAGGTSGYGTVFKLTPPAAGKTAWTETVLAAFTGGNGANPFGSLIADTAGNLYGTTSGAGTKAEAGTVFELTQ
jgi:uncharacterized repeat protein (TIGR03803 family)